jgi:hypothetical protein
VKFARLIAKTALLVLGLAVSTTAQAKEGSITIRLKAVKGRVEAFYRGQKLTDPKLAQLCAARRERKGEINFQRDKMSSGDTMAALLKEADCLGAKRVGSAGADRHGAAQKSLAQTHAIRPHRAAAPQ